MLKHMIDECVMYNPNLDDAEFYIPEGEEFCIVAIDSYGTKWLYDSLSKNIYNLTWKEEQDAKDNSEFHYRIEFAKYLDRKMLHRGFTQSDLAEATGISQVMIGKYLSGESLPSIYRVKIIANALGYEIGEFVDGVQRIL